MSELSAMGKLMKAFELSIMARVGMELTYFDVIDLVGHIKALEEDAAISQSQLAATQARLAAYEEGFDPKVKAPEECELILANSASFGWRVVVYSHGWFDEGVGGVGFGVSSRDRWFPLPGSKGGDE